MVTYMIVFMRKHARSMKTDLQGATASALAKGSSRALVVMAFLARFFRVTGLVLVVVAAGLVMTAFHTANEAGWLTVGQAQAFDLPWLVRPGTPVSSLLTGVLGIEPYPVWIEVIAWLAYLVPMLILVAWPSGPAKKPRPAAAPSPAVGQPAQQ